MKSKAVWFLVLMLLPVAIASANPGSIEIQNFDRSEEAFSIGSSDVIGGAGGDVAASFESSDRSFDINTTSGWLWDPENWHVDVRRTDILWHADLHVYIRRTSNGSGATLSGGTTYQEITTSDMSFFSGSGYDCANIAIRYQISGSYAALGIPADTYQTTITYTVTGD
jgi:hypothetical protein